MATGGLPSAFTTYAPLSRPKEAKGVLEASRRYEGFRGVRFMLDFHPTRPELCQTDRGDYFSDPAFLEGLRLVESMGGGLIFELQLCQLQLEDAAEKLVKQFPKLTFVLNHAGFPLRGGYDEWARGITALAKFPNVQVKVGGLGCYDSPAWSQDEVNRVVGHVLAAFGHHRTMFASNLPVDLIDFPDPRARFLSLLRAAKANGMTQPKVLRALFHDNATFVYRLDLTTTTP
mmetsp:Transcript_8255/g.27050  ORF Transcript_8255/g.27050 Transcript_8255/m.27050 type:complete len:231 (-) Transcript_8255:149-841(-)